MSAAGAAPLVLVTRPAAEAEETAAKLRARGFAPFVEPMLEIVPRPGPMLELAGVQAILVTSGNGARLLAERTPVRDRPVFAVGDTTQATLAALGFTRVRSAGADAEALAELVKRSCNPAAGALVHARGAAIQVDPALPLTAAGFAIWPVVLYDACPVSAFSPALERTMRERQLRYALFFSSRTAEAFVRLAGVAGLIARCDVIEACCLSPAIAAALDGVRWRAVRSAVRRDQDAMLDLLPRTGRAEGM